MECWAVLVLIPSASMPVQQVLLLTVAVVPLVGTATSLAPFVEIQQWVEAAKLPLSDSWSVADLLVGPARGPSAQFPVLVVKTATLVLWKKLLIWSVTEEHKEPLVPQA